MSDVTQIFEVMVNGDPETAEELIPLVIRERLERG